MTASGTASPQQLRASESEIPLPFAVDPGDGSMLVVGEIARLLPGRRLAGVADWQGRRVFVKLFYGSGAVRQGQRERQGLERLAAAGIPTPALVHAGPWSADAYLVVTEYVPDATPLAEEAAPTQLLAAFALLGKLHRAGLGHRDAHLGNFLATPAGILLIDGDGIYAARDNAALLDNFALFCAQMPSRWPVLCAPALTAYGRPLDASRVRAAVDKALARRLAAYLAKSLRNCSEFSILRDTRRWSVVRRDAAADLKALLADPDAAMRQGEILKDGRTCTVARARAGDRPVVIKRYNLKNWRHAVSRSWRPSRAWNSWIEGNRLGMLGIPTAQPLALVEERLGPLRGRAFLVAADVDGPSLRELLDPDDSPEGAVAESLQSLLDALYRHRIVHGDLKATNLLWHGGAVHLIDLDAQMQQHRPWRFRRGWARDRERLLANWPPDSSLSRWLAAIVPGGD